MAGNKQVGKFTFTLPLDASGIKDFKPDRAVKVVAYDPKGGAFLAATVEFDAKGQGKAVLTLPAAGILRVLVGPEKATAEELKGLQTIGADVLARQWQNKLN